MRENTAVSTEKVKKSNTLKISKKIWGWRDNIVPKAPCLPCRTDWHLIPGATNGLLSTPRSYGIIEHKARNKPLSLPV